MRPMPWRWMLLAPLALAACGDDSKDGSDAAADSDVATDSDAAPDSDVATTDSDAAVDSDVAATDSDAAEDSDVAADTVSPRRNTCTAPASAAVEEAAVPAGFCASIWASGLGGPRGLFVTEGGDVLTVEAQNGRVTALWDADGNGLSGDGERATIARANGLNHGVTVHDGFLYASSQTTVYRWAYSAGARSDLGDATTIIKGIPAGGHSTRTLVFDAQGRLYVSVGSGSNVDSDSSRARIRRFDVSSVPAGGLAFSDGEVFADGLRNEVGLAFDGNGVLWGVQNGMDEIRRDDLGGDVHDDNPAEILSRFGTAGAFHGYPYCWAEFLLPQGVGGGPGTMWAHASTINDGTHSDAWCKDTARVQPPALAMQAHSAPLDLEFYDGASFPESFRGDLFITFHGSWNRDEPTGYKVVHVDFDGQGKPLPPEDFLAHDGPGANGWPHRPVAVRVGKDGQLFVSSDASDAILVIGHRGD